MASKLRISAAGDSAIVIEFEGLDAASDASAWAPALAARVRGLAVDGVLDVVPALRTVGVHFDPLRISPDRLEVAVRSIDPDRSGDGAPEGTGTLHQIPVCYGGSFGPDLAEVAAMTGLSEDAVVSEHTAAVYRVLMLGFMPGFAYMGPVGSAIVVSRRATPRVSIPAGSVAIAGHQTGIYPSESPGGWRIIGRTSVRPFDLDRVPPFLFAPGDEVQFRAVPSATFAQDER
jgi:inhibitor of KinA